MEINTLAPEGFETSVQEYSNSDKVAFKSFILFFFKHLFSRMLSVDFTRPVTEADDESQNPWWIRVIDVRVLFPVLSAAPADT